MSQREEALSKLYTLRAGLSLLHEADPIRAHAETEIANSCREVNAILERDKNIPIIKGADTGKTLGIEVALKKRLRKARILFGIAVLSFITFWLCWIGFIIVSKEENDGAARKTLSRTKRQLNITLKREPQLRTEIATIEARLQTIHSDTKKLLGFSQSANRVLRTEFATILSPQYWVYLDDLIYLLWAGSANTIPEALRLCAGRAPGTILEDRNAIDGWSEREEAVPALQAFAAKVGIAPSMLAKAYRAHETQNGNTLSQGKDIPSYEQWKRDFLANRGAHAVVGGCKESVGLVNWSYDDEGDRYRRRAICSAYDYLAAIESLPATQDLTLTK